MSRKLVRTRVLSVTKDAGSQRKAVKTQVKNLCEVAEMNREPTNKSQVLEQLTRQKRFPANSVKEVDAQDEKVGGAERDSEGTNAPAGSLIRKN